MLADPGTDQDKFDYGKRTKAQGDAEAVLATTDAYVVSKKSRKRTIPTWMMRTHRCEVMMACIQGAISDELVETETTPATSSMTRPAHLKSTVPRSRRVWNSRKTSTKTS